MNKLFKNIILKKSKKFYLLMKLYIFFESLVLLFFNLKLKILLFCKWKFAPVAQLDRALGTDQEVLGSNPSRRTKTMAILNKK